MREPTPREEAIFDALAEVARPVILSAFTADSCIASTRIGIDVLTYFGIHAREMPVLIAVFNPEAVALVEQGMGLEEIGVETRKHTAEAEGGPWTMAIGAPTGRPEGWAGHLVVTHPETGVVIDLSADQATRPHKNIHLEPYWLRVTAQEWWDDPTESYPVRSEAGLILIFDRRVPDPVGYVRTDNWRRKVRGSTAQGLYKDLTGQIIREVRARVG